MQHENKTFIDNWVKYMQENCGDTVLDLDEGKTISWSEALAKEVYGKDYKNHSGFIGMRKNLEKGLDLPKIVADRAKSWAAGEWPSWIKSGTYTNFKGNSAVFNPKHPSRLEDKEPTDKIIYRKSLNIK